MGQPSSTAILTALAPLLLMSVAVTMGLFVRMPWFAVLALVGLHVAGATENLRKRESKSGIGVGWLCTLVAWGGFLLGDGWILTLDPYYIFIAWLIAAAVVLAGQRHASSLMKPYWSVLGLAWGLIAALIWIAVAYHLNLRLQFHLGLVTLAGLLVAAKMLFRLPFLAVQAANTLLLLCLGLPLADLFVRPNYRLDETPETGKRYYSYEFARKNPTAFAHWWNHFVEEWRNVLQTIALPDVGGEFPFVLLPNTEGQMFQSRVHINNLGFRGPDIPLEKGDAYRIVALGESTTFGHTIAATDVPWPELLQREIEGRLKPGRPVQVINAGIPSYTVRLNVQRLAKQILPLKPDMIISYHGYNGFMWLNPALPPVHGKGPPNYVDRPLKLLADCEYRLKMTVYRQGQIAQRPSANRVPADPMQTEYARAYEDLIQIARTNGIRLVLANYSMAVNSNSEPDVVTFYRAVFPKVRSQIQANEVHSGIIQQLGRRHPEVSLVDTHAGLDGVHEQFIDLVHFTGEGERHFAETMFRGIEPLLKQDLKPGSAVSANGSK
jgi:lysophospholipase L1-like esterase